MTLREQMATDSVDTFLNVDEFAESVTYIPHRYFGETARADRTITAIVEREQVTAIVGSETEILPIYTVHVANDATSGIASDEIDRGSDFIDFPSRDGLDATRKTIIRIVNQDPAMLVLECR